MNETGEQVRIYGPPGFTWWDEKSHTSNMSYLCPDMLSLRNIGVADNLRGRVVRAFFIAISWWKP